MPEKLSTEAKRIMNSGLLRAIDTTLIPTSLWRLKARAKKAKLPELSGYKMTALELLRISAYTSLTYNCLI